MACNSIERIHNCSKCEFRCTDCSILKNTSALNVVTAAATILWNNRFTERSTCNTINYSITISCIGNIRIVPDLENSNLSYDIAIDMYVKMLDAWYTANSKSGCVQYQDKVLETLKEIQQTSNINKIRQRAISLAKYITISTRCNEKSIATATSSVVNSSFFALSDLCTVSKLISTAVVDLLNTVIRYVSDLTVPNLFISADTCYVTYTGNILFSTHLTSCKSTLKAAKIMYSLYLNSWCKSNFTKCSEIIKIKRSIDLGNRTKSLAELYEVSVKLLDNLSH